MEKRLTRSTSERWIAGVCGGLAQYFDIDPVIVRVIFFVAAWIGLGGVIVYGILWIVMPEDTDVPAPASGPDADMGDGGGAGLG